MSESNQHYKIHKPEPLELIQRYNLSFIEGNVVKYVMRRPFKGDSTGDLNKAMEYAQLLQDIGFYRQFEASELNEYTELTELEKEIVCDVLRADVSCTVQKLQKAIGIRGMQNVKKALGKRFAWEKEKVHKPFDPDWLPPHPLYTLLEVVDQDPYKFMEMLEEKCNEEFGIGGDPKISAGCIALSEVLVPESYFMKALTKLGCGSEQFWKNRYDDYWEKRKRKFNK